jgi:hypothetical protein
MAASAALKAALDAALGEYVGHQDVAHLGGALAELASSLGGADASLLPEELVKRGFLIARDALRPYLH